MSRRFLELMAAAGLAPSMLEREQLRGQQAAQNANAISSAFGTSLNALTGAAFKAGDVMKADAQENADTVAKQALADNATSTGSHALLPGAEYGAQPGMEDPTSFAQTPGDLAKSAVDSNPALNAPKKTGDWLGDFVADPFGFKADAAAKAKATAQGGIANEVTASRDKATALSRQQALDAQKATGDAAETALRTQEAATQKANADTEAKKLQLESDKADAEMNLKGFEEQDRRAQIAKLADKSKGGAGGGKRMSASDIDQMINSPRAAISDLDNLKAASATAPSGAQAAAGDAASHVPIFGASLQEEVAPGQQDYRGQAAIALAKINNAMDKRVSAKTLEIWEQQIDNPRLTKEQRDAKIEEIKASLLELQNQREKSLTSAGYNVPGASPENTAKPGTKPAASTPATSDRVTVRDRDGTLLSIPRSVLSEAMADGAVVVQ